MTIKCKDRAEAKDRAWALRRAGYDAILLKGAVIEADIPPEYAGMLAIKPEDKLDRLMLGQRLRMA